MAVAEGSALCAYHFRRQSRIVSGPGDKASINDDTAAELLAGIKDFKSTAAVNLFLGNVVQQVVRKRINRRDAVTLAYLSQLLLNSLSVMSRDHVREAESRPRFRLVDDICRPRNSAVTPAPTVTQT